MITRISKIARLPATIREQLNRRLHNGELGRTLLPWLNNLPETKRVLDDLFAGKTITHQNLSEWRHGGYQDWLLHQQRLEWFDRLTEQEAELEAHDRCGDTFETLGRFFLFEIGQACAALQNIKNPQDRWARLQNLNHEFARLQNAYNWSRRVQLEWSKYNGQPKTHIPQLQNRKPETITATSLEPDDNETHQNLPRANQPEEPATLEPHVPELNPTGYPEPITATEFDETERQSAGALEDTSPSSGILDQRASVLDCGGPPPLSDTEPKEPTAFQPIPTPAPTTQLPIPISELLTRSQTLKPTNPKPRPSPPPIRGRRFRCIEG